MPTDNSASNTEQNRRENFRIDDLLATSVQKVANGVLPVARIIPVALSESGRLGGGLRPFAHEIDPSFALMLLEANTKLDLLFEFFKMQKYNDEKDLRPSLTQLLLQVNTKLDSLLDFHHIARLPETTRVGEVSLSASGIKLTTQETLDAGDLVRFTCFVHGSTLLGRDRRLVARQTRSGGNQVAINLPTNATIQDVSPAHKPNSSSVNWLEPWFPRSTGNLHQRLDCSTIPKEKRIPTC
jgi:hypothetical protein